MEEIPKPKQKEKEQITPRFILRRVSAISEDPKKEISTRDEEYMTKNKLLKELKMLEGKSLRIAKLTEGPYRVYVVWLKKREEKPAERKK